MYCNRCGNVVEESDRFCSNCGAPIVKAESVNNPYAVGTQYENSRQFDVDAPDIPGFGGAIATCFHKFFSIRGRASRSEYWFWVLFIVLTYWLPLALGNVLIRMKIIVGVGVLLVFAGLIQGIVCVCPGICVGVRRLHDIGRSGWFVLLKIVPCCMYTVVLTASFFLSVVIVDVYHKPLDEVLGNTQWITWLAQICSGLFLTGKLVLAILACLPGQKGDNKYGKEPVKHVQ